MANTFNLGNGSWAQKTEKLLAYNAENDNYKPLPFDFDRASTATRVNKQGLIETVGIDEPRIDFLNNTKGHLLLEPQRTNYVVYSETEGIIYGSNGWIGNSESDAIVTRNYGTTPFSGTELKSTRLQYSGSNKDFRNEFTAVTIQAAATIYVKGTSGETIKFGTTSNQSVFTLTGDWQKIEQIDSTSRSSSRLTINTFSGATARDIEIYAPQVEDGSYATSYIPTQGSAVTRSAETGVDCLLPNETIIDNSTATVYFEFEALADDASNRWISFEEVGTATDNQFEIRLAAAFNLIQIVTRSSGGGQDVTMSETLTDITANNKIALNYNGLNWKLAVNGTITDTATAARLFNDNIEKIKFSRYANTNHFYGKVKDLRVYNTALTDAELIALTS